MDNEDHNEQSDQPTPSSKDEPEKTGKTPLEEEHTSANDKEIAPQDVVVEVKETDQSVNDKSQQPIIENDEEEKPKELEETELSMHEEKKTEELEETELSMHEGAASKEQVAARPSMLKGEERKPSAAVTKTVRHSVTNDAQGPHAQPSALKTKPHSKPIHKHVEMPVKSELSTISSQRSYDGRHRRKSSRTRKREEVHCRVRFAMLGVVMAAAGLAGAVYSLQQLIRNKAAQSVFNTKFENTLAWLDNLTATLENKLVEHDRIIAKLRTESFPLLEISIKDNDARIAAAVEENRKLAAFLASDCEEIFGLFPEDKSGIYYITIDDIHTVSVYCDMTSDGGGWTAFQRRYNGIITFNRNFDEYEKGFGSAKFDYWLGLRPVALMMKKKNYMLRIDLFQRGGAHGHVTYRDFSLNTTNRLYSLELGNYTEKNIFDGMRRYVGQPFSTRDRDLDSHVGINCADVYDSPWWVDNCRTTSYTCLNSVFRPYALTPINRDELRWYQFEDTRIIRTEMKIREQR